MSKKRIIWQIYPPFLAVTLLALIAMAVYASQVYQSLFLTQVRHDLETSATLLKDSFLPYLESNNFGAIDALCKKAGQESKIRVTLIDSEGNVLGDSERTPNNMDNHATRLEFVTALSGKIGSSERYSQTMQQNMMYVAIPIRLNVIGGTTHSLRTSITTQLIYQGQQTFYLRILIPTLLIALLAASICWYLSRRITKPLGEMQAGAKRFAEGNLDTLIDAPESEEMYNLAQALNQMAQQIEHRILKAQEKRKELETILTNMSEGVIALNATAHLKIINKAAEEIFKCTYDDFADRPLVEFARNYSLITLVTDAINKEKNREDQITFTNNGEQVFNVSVNPVFNTEGQISGVVIVFSDITKQAKLETMRKDFVANVSHELKTPITSIKGYVETLLETKSIDKDTRHRFLNIVAKQSDRMHDIIEDLLQLSRLDNDSTQVPMEAVSTNSLVESANEVCSQKAKKRNSVICITMQENVKVIANAALLEQAIINLLDNAIKYSPDKSEINLTLFKDNTHATIQVSDKGKGIAEKHHDRIFERFYRIDKARSRSDGSTGLGLAIVKHITLLHKGEISLQSSEGNGSTFSIKFPLAKI